MPKYDVYFLIHNIVSNILSDVTENKIYTTVDIKLIDHLNQVGGNNDIDTGVGDDVIRMIGLGIDFVKS